MCVLAHALTPSSGLRNRTVTVPNYWFDSGQIVIVFLFDYKENISRDTFSVSCGKFLREGVSLEVPADRLWFL